MPLLVLGRKTRLPGLPHGAAQLAGPAWRVHLGDSIHICRVVCRVCRSRPTMRGGVDEIEVVGRR